MRTNIYVLAEDGTPLMPIHSYHRAKKLLREHKARVVCTKPYTLRLKYTINNPVTELCTIKEDPGRTNIGLCVTDEDNKLWSTGNAFIRMVFAEYAIALGLLFFISGILLAQRIILD